MVLPDQSALAFWLENKAGTAALLARHIRNNALRDEPFELAPRRKHRLSARRPRKGRNLADLARERHRVCLESACRFAEHRLNPQEVIVTKAADRPGNCTLANVSRNFPVRSGSIRSEPDSPRRYTRGPRTVVVCARFLGVLGVTHDHCHERVPVLAMGRVTCGRWCGFLPTSGFGVGPICCLGAMSRCSLLCWFVVWEAPC